MKTFKQFINEDVEFDYKDIILVFRKHFIERLALRSGQSENDLKQILSTLNESINNYDLLNFIKKIVSKLPEIQPTGEFLFYSKDLHYGIICDWNAFQKRIKFITLLPYSRDVIKKNTVKINIS